MESVAVIDYGMGNLRSVTKALEHVNRRGASIEVTADASQILAADRVIFPGVGAIRDCMKELRRLGLDSVIEKTAGTRPVLGICLGLQALLEFSEENEGTDCLGLLPGRVRYFGQRLSDPDSGAALKIPHMGWNQVHQCFEHPLWQGIPQDTRFYFVHSYYAESTQPDLVAGTTDYGRTFACALASGSLFAVQFHPEKSQHAGLALLDNFLRWDGKP